MQMSLLFLKLTVCFIAHEFYLHLCILIHQTFCIDYDSFIFSDDHVGTANTCVLNVCEKERRMKERCTYFRLKNKKFLDLIQIVLDFKICCFSKPGNNKIKSKTNLNRLVLQYGYKQRQESLGPVYASEILSSSGDSIRQKQVGALVLPMPIPPLYTTTKAAIVCLVLFTPNSKFKGSWKFDRDWLRQDFKLNLATFQRIYKMYPLSCVALSRKRKQIYKKGPGACFHIDQ